MKKSLLGLLLIVVCIGIFSLAGDVEANGTSLNPNFPSYAPAPNFHTTITWTYDGDTSPQWMHITDNNWGRYWSKWVSGATSTSSSGFTPTYGVGSNFPGFAPGTTYTFELETFAGGPGQYFDVSYTAPGWARPDVRVTISNSYVKPDGTTPYQISVIGSSASGGSTISHQYARINFQGGNVGQYRGYLTWYIGNPGWAGQIQCNEGYAALQPDYGGSTYMFLDSCVSSAPSGSSERTVTFNVRFKTAFAAPYTNNDISGYAYSPGGESGWKNSDLNFGLVFPPSLVSVTPDNSTILLTNQNSITLTVTGVTNATLLRFYMWTTVNDQDDIICPEISVSQMAPHTETLTINPNNSTCLARGKATASLSGTGPVYLHVYAYNAVNDFSVVGREYSRIQPGNVNINIPVGIAWTLTPPAGWNHPSPYPAEWKPATFDYRGTGPFNLTNLPYGSYTLTPAARPGYTVQVGPENPQTLGN